MPRPTLLKHIHSEDDPHAPMNWVQAEDQELGVENPNPIPINADTFKGHPLEHFASVDYVSQVLSAYVATVLGKSY